MVLSCFVFCFLFAAIDYSVDIFGFLHAQFVSTFRGPQNKEIPVAKHNPLPGARLLSAAICSVACELLRVGSISSGVRVT
jgi:hypothetical protein